MLRLPDLQREFFLGITGAHGVCDHAGEASPLTDAIQDQGGLAPAERLAIYARMYRIRLVEALATDYPRVATILGPDPFGEVARHYIAAVPSTHPSLRWFGRGFADFLAAREDPSQQAFLADLARLEWARLAVFDAPDADLLAVETLRRLPADGWVSLRLRPIPALEVLHVGWPVHRIWDAADGDASTPWSPADTWLRVWRQGDQVFQATMDAVEHTALRHVRAGDDFGELCVGLATVVPVDTIAATAGALVLRWIEDGLLGADASPS